MRLAAPAVLAAVLFLATCDGNGLPTSGAEPKYDPARWNHPGWPAGWGDWSREERLAWLQENEEGRRVFQLYRVQLRNNCYNYACNKRTVPTGSEIPFEPGRGGGYVPPGSWCTVDENGREVATTANDPSRALCSGDLTCAVLRAASVADGLVETDCTKRCPEGSYKKALVLDSLTVAEKADTLSDVTQTDYHWLRQDSTGNWSHKPGEQPATDRAPGDAAGNGGGGPIPDPRAATARRNYTVFCGCFCCGSGVRKAELPATNRVAALLGPTRLLAASILQPDTGAMADAATASDTTAASGIDVAGTWLSGRRNPRWRISDPAEMAAVVSMLRGLPPAPRPDWPLLGWRGFLLVTEDPALLVEHGLVPAVRVHGGVVEIGTETYRDANGLEAWLLSRYPPSFPAPPAGAPY